MASGCLYVSLQLLPRSYHLPNAHVTRDTPSPSHRYLGQTLRSENDGMDFPEDQRIEGWLAVAILNTYDPLRVVELQESG